MNTFEIKKSIRGVAITPEIIRNLKKMPDTDMS